MQEPAKDTKKIQEQIFTGNVFIFHAFDVGDDINLEKISLSPSIQTIPLSLPKYFKNYHIPLAIELPHPHTTSHCISSKIYNFGAISLTYKIPFTDTLENLRASLEPMDNQFQEQSMIDIKSVFKKIEKDIAQPNFYQTKSSYLVIQVDPRPDILSLKEFKEHFGGIVASALRFETESLSEYLKNEILDAATGYYRGDLIIIDTDASFVYDDEYEEIIDFFEFANIQQLELRYYDRLLDMKLNSIYEKGVPRLPFRSYLPILSLLTRDPVAALGKLKADISVIVERLEGSIKLIGEPYFSELYELLFDKLDLRNWYRSIDRKLEILTDIQIIYQNKTNAVREEILSMLIIILIFIELIIGILHYLKL